MFVKPMLAAALPEKKKPLVTYENGYILEPKHDGMRAVVAITEDGVEVYSRVGKTYADRIPKLVGDFIKLPVGTILDGELMVVKEWIEVGYNVPVPVPDFNATMRVMGSNADKAIAKQEEHTVDFFAFDVIQWAGRDITNLKYSERIKYVDKLRDYDTLYIEVASEWGSWNQSDLDGLVKAGIEGAILKHVDSLYHIGKRKTNTWFKFKIEETADVVVTGFTDAKEGVGGKFLGQIGAIKFGAYNADGELVEVGQCSGMTDEVRLWWTNIRDTGGELGQVIEIKYNDLVGTGEFRTPRHPQYRGIREDKLAEDCSMDQFKV